MRQRKIMLGLSFVLLSVIMIIGMRQPVFAAQEHMDFEVQMVSSSHQVDRDKRFFDLGLSADQQATIEVKVHNFSEKPIKVHSEIENGITQMGGGMIYRPTKTGIIRDTQQTLIDVAQVKAADRVVTIGPNAVKRIQATIKMPSGTTQGMIYGAWHFIEYGKQSDTDHSSVAGNYAYNIGIMLHGQHYQTYPELKYQKVEPIIKNGHAALGIQLNNVKPMIIKNAQVKAVIAKEGFFKNKRVYQASNVDVAPNSQFTVPISWGYDQMKPGKYTVAVEVKGHNYWNQLPMTWHFKKQITVNRQQATQINHESLKKPTNRWAYVATASGILMLLSFGLVYRVLKLTRGL